MRFKIPGWNATLVRAAVFGIVVLGSSRAGASDTYPPVLKASLGLSQDPPCTVCHQTIPGQKGNATQPFAVSLKSKLDLGSGSPKSLRAILTQAEDIDSDGDGMTDLDELRNDRNPNIADRQDGEGGLLGAGPSAAPPVLRTGCSVVVRGHETSGTLSLVAAVFVALSTLGRGRRRRRPI